MTPDQYRREGFRLGIEAAARLVSDDAGVPVDGYFIGNRDRSAKERATMIRAIDVDEVLAGMPPVWQPIETVSFLHDLVQVLCRVTQPQTSDFPRACEMPVSSGDHAVDDVFVSIGWRDEDGDWHVAGWEMTQYCWTDARCFEVLGWAELMETPNDPAIDPAEVLAKVGADALTVTPQPATDAVAGETSITEEQRADIIEAAHFRFRRYSVGIHGQVITEWDSIESHVVMETLRWVEGKGCTQ